MEPDAIKNFIATPQGKVVACVVIGLAIWGAVECGRALERKESESKRISARLNAPGNPAPPAQIPHPREKPPIRSARKGTRGKGAGVITPPPSAEFPR